MPMLTIEITTKNTTPDAVRALLTRLRRNLRNDAVAPGQAGVTRELMAALLTPKWTERGAELAINGEHALEAVHFLDMYARDRGFEVKSAKPQYVYHVLRDDNGEFSAEVRTTCGTALLEIVSERGAGDIWLLRNGFMRDKYDTEGLEYYLRENEMIENDAHVLTVTEYEQRVDSVSVGKLSRVAGYGC